MALTTRLTRTAFAPFRLTARLFSGLALRRHRVRLSQLDDALLRDIGLTREQALAEAKRPFWDAASHWRM